jgi:hypothetical protein
MRVMSSALLSPSRLSPALLSPPLRGLRGRCYGRHVLVTGHSGGAPEGASDEAWSGGGGMCVWSLPQLEPLVALSTVSTLSLSLSLSLVAVSTVSYVSV